MNEPKKITLTVTNQEGDKLLLEGAWDSTAEDMIHYFKVIMLFLTFPEDTINECFVSEE